MEKPELREHPDCNTIEEIIHDLICDIDFDFNLTWAYMLGVESTAHELAYRTKDDEHIALWEQMKKMRKEFNKAHVDLMAKHDKEPVVIKMELLADHTSSENETT
jgi:hypothetical protein